MRPVTEADMATGEALEALGRVWHKDHFQCHSRACEANLGDSRDFFSSEDMGCNWAYCRDHFLELFVPQCAECGDKVLSQGIKVLIANKVPSAVIAVMSLFVFCFWIDLLPLSLGDGRVAA
jgi:hypothetical protein